MKKIYVSLIFALIFSSLAFPQKDSVIEIPKVSDSTAAPLSSNTVTCTFGVDVLTLVINGTDLLCNGDNSGAATVVANSASGSYSYHWFTTPVQTAANATGLSAGTKSVEVWDGAGNDCVVSVVLGEPSALIVNMTPAPRPPTCFGFCDGVATANPTGTGTAPYTYSWNTSPVQTTPSATGLCNGLHQVIVTDANGCTTPKTVNLTQPFPLAANGVATTIDCYGNCNGGASVAPTGGTAPYTYSWAPGAETTSAISSLCVNDYTCTISDSHSCTLTYIAAITQPPLLTMSVTGTNPLCNGTCNGSVASTVGGGTSPYTYNWMPGGYNTSSVSGLCADTYTLTVKDANNCSKTATITLTQPGVLTSAPTGTDISCFGQCDGTANANAGGGTSPYTYSWSPGGYTTSACSGLCAGTFSVTVADANGCTIIKTITLSQPVLLTITPSKTDESCAGTCDGTVTAVASGGTAPYTYAWSPSGCTTSSCSGLCAGTYSILITDAHNCVATSNVTIGFPTTIIPNLSSVAATCAGNCDGSVISATTGGTAPYTYSWSSGCITSACSGLCAGNYSVLITDAGGCNATGTVNVGQPSMLTTSIASAIPNPLKCNGDCNGVVLTSVSGGTPAYTYLWSNSATTASLTGLCAGGYTLTVTDSHNCIATTSVIFTQPAILSNSVSATNPTCNSGCNGVITSNPNGGTTPYTYFWQPGGQTTSAISGQCIGDYTITVSDAGGCSTTQTVSLTAPSVVVANASVVKNVSCSGSCDGIATTSPTGGTGAYTYIWTGGSITQSASNLCAGTATVIVKDANGCFDQDVLTITQPSSLLSIVSSQTSSCNLCTGTASISTVGGTAPYTYFWTPGGQSTSSVSGLCVGNYTVSITDANNCSNTLTLTIAPQINIALSTSGSGVSCLGSCDASAMATASGGTAPYTYVWNSAPVQTTQAATGLCAGNYTVAVTDGTGCISTNTVSFTSPTAITTTVSSVSASCSLCNGSAAVSASGGTGTLTYLWSGFPIQTSATATGLCPGNYTVTIKDANNCSATNTVTVGNVSAINDNASITNATCGSSNGSICVAPSGGIPAYTYDWAPGGATTSCISGLAAGIYTVTISDGTGCSSDFPIAMNTTNGPTVTITALTNPTCNASCDGSISVSASGSAPFSYLWSPGGQITPSISALCAGTYIVRVNDNVPCTTYSSLTLTDPPQIDPNPTITNVSCNGGNNGSVCLSPTGGTAPYTFTWDGGAAATTSCVTGLSAGTHTVLITDVTSCSRTVTIPIGEPTVLSLSITATNIGCNGSNNGTATANVSGGTTPYTYAWSTGSALPGIVGLSPGTYSVIVADNMGCTTSGSVTITEPPALITTISSTNITCNSLCDGTTSVTASGGTGTYTYLWGPGGEITSALSGLCAGSYAIRVTDAAGCTSTQTVTVTEPGTVSVTVTTTNGICSGDCNGTASANLSGGTGAYTYLWNAGGLTTSSVTGLCANGYTLTATDANGCSASKQFSITTPAAIQANLTKIPASCNSKCDGVVSASPSGGTAPYTYFWSNGQTTSSITGLCPNTYTLILSDASGCSVVNTTTISPSTTLTQTSNVAGATCLVCNGSIAVVGAGGTSPYSFFWSNGATTATITGLCAGLYIDTMMDAKGCISVDTIPLSNATGPTVMVTGTNVNCYGACDGTATVSSVSGDGPPWIYAWYYTTPTQTTQTATGLCANQYFGSVTDKNGCATFASVNITEPTQMVSNPLVTNATCFGICDGNITTSATGGTGAYTYAWLPGGQTTSALSLQCAGDYTLTLSDASNCSITTTITIGQNTILSASVTSTNNTCNASCDGTASVTISGGTQPYTYTWSGGQTTSSVTGLCAGNYTVTAKDAIGCIGNPTITITEPAILAANISAINPLCNGDCNGSVTSATTGGTAPYTYVWMPGGLTTSSVSALCAGSYSLMLTDANTCAVTTTVTLTDPAPLSALSSIVNASCGNTCDGNISITPAGGTSPYTFAWMPTGQTTQNATGLCAGDYSLTITDANACTVSYTMSVGANTVVTAIAGNDTSFCLGGMANLSSRSVNAASVNWYQLPAWTLIGNTNVISVSPAAGITSYALVAYSGVCSDTDTVNVTVFNYPVVIANNATICAGTSASLCASGANTYQWYNLPAWTPIATGSCIIVAPGAGVADYAVVGRNGLCSDTDSVAVIVQPMPIANAGRDTAFCEGYSVTLCNNQNQIGNTSKWYQLPAWTLLGTDSCTTVAPLITSEYALIVSNGFCSDTDSVSVVVYMGPIANAGADATILLSESTVLNGSGSGAYLWTPSAGLNTTTDPNPIATPTATTTYVLHVTDVNGCTSSDTVLVTVLGNVVPNDGISPNGDGSNDIWIIPGIEAFPKALVEVYNRWGELLYSTTDYKNNKWGGTYKGKPLPVGTYYYIINLNSEYFKDPITGPITILR